MMVKREDIKKILVMRRIIEKMGKKDEIELIIEKIKKKKRNEELLD